MLVEIAAGFIRARPFEGALGFGTAVSEAIFAGAVFTALPVGSFTGRPQIDDFSHAWS
jgi:hypothetical protein